MNKNFGLTQERFDQLVVQLQHGDEQLFERVFLAHFKDCMSYLRRNYRASHEDAYDVSMDTLLIFHKRLKAGKVNYGNLRFLFTQMAGQNYKRWIKKEVVMTDLELIEKWEEPSLMDIDEEEMQVFDAAWIQLGDKCKTLLKSFYYEKTTLNDIAQQFNQSPATIRKQKQRCVEKLRTLFQHLSNVRLVK